jgi:cell division protein FtsB
MSIKKIFIRFILCAEMCVFGYIYLFGKTGLQLLSVQKKELIFLELQSAQLQKEIDILESDIYVWQTNDFYKEKIAREQLQMARKHDKIFYIGI